MELVERVYRLTKTLSRTELYGLTSQMQRAAVSIPSNIAEGHTRNHRGEYLQHLAVAQASLAELQTQLEIVGRLGYATSEELSPVNQHAVALAKQLHALRNALGRTPSTQPPIPNP